ncbi:Ribosomal protein L1/ribosomal biogenesis protein [Carpediemonas membranifera]|uniref:Ribosomal protein L1/ribosomal biogenesis protein n=1 Tax=Carpediemonas membranifera TaxID=201153 RepID=A0A8J6EB50_9EUKA|nr:Ribosomal protein L1/ribosomal biogenesis protein [Carpediemonas membranifera]|eukprot:KAG9396265.1 Ribosomal protein L1/ribosomal biogenesis protein [Carpediemonas membranifera]
MNFKKSLAQAVKVIRQSEGDEASDSQPVELLVSMFEAFQPKNDTPAAIKLPNIPHVPVDDEDNVKVCLIVRDDTDDVHVKAAVKAALEEVEMDFTLDVRKLAKVRGKTSSFKDMKAFLQEYSLILGDKTIYGKLTKLFAGYSKGIRVKLYNDAKAINPETVRTAVLGAVNSTKFLYRGHGLQTITRVGHTGLDDKQIIANAKAIIDVLSAADEEYAFIGGLTNIHTIHMKTPGSIAVPVYVKTRELTAKVEKRAAAEIEEAEQEETEPALIVKKPVKKVKRVEPEPEAEPEAAPVKQKRSKSKKTEGDKKPKSLKKKH